MSIQELQDIISKKFDESALDGIVTNYSGLSDVKIKEIKLGASSAKGDSYLSIVSRFCIKAEGTNKVGTNESVEVPVIVKALPKNIGRRKTFRSLDFFKNEVIFYEKVWPELKKFQKSKNIAEPFNGVPLLLSAYIDGENDYIALEDLSYKGYGNIMRANSLDYEATMIIMKLFAKFHGLALAYKEQDPAAFEEVATSLQETYFAEKYRQWYSKFQRTLCDITQDAVEKELPSRYLEKLNSFFSKDIFGLLCKHCEVRGPLSAVTHGDSWLPNFLIKYGDNNSILDAMMIDFQLTRYTTISNDLTFFLYVCTDYDLWDKHWDDLLEEYHKTLIKTMNQLGSKGDYITLDVLKEDVKRSAFFGIGMAIEAITMSLLEENQVSDLDNIQGDVEVPLESVWIVKPFNSPEKRRRLADAIKHAVDNGFI